MKSYQLALAPTNCATVPEARSEPPKQDNVEKFFPTDDSVEQEKKSRKRSRQRSESSDTDVPPDKAKNLFSEREKHLRLQGRIKKVAENNRKIEKVSQSSMKKLDEKANLSTEVDRIHKEIAEKSEMCQKRKRDLQAKKDKNLERGREAKNRMEAELEKMKIGNELADFNFNDAEDWLDVLKKVKEEIRECSSDEEAISRLEAELVGLQDVLEEKGKMQNTVIQELKALDNQLVNLYSELKAISEEGLECHGGEPHKKRSKLSEEDQGERVHTPEVQSKDASQPLTDAIDSGQTAANKQRVEEEGNPVAPDRIATFDSCASPTHWTLLDHDYTARADIEKIQNDSAHQNSSGSSTVISKTSKEMDEELTTSEKPGSQSGENAPEKIRMETGECATKESSKKGTIASKKSEVVKNIDVTMANGNEKAKTSTIQEEVRKESATSSPETSQGTPRATQFSKEMRRESRRESEGKHRRQSNSDLWRSGSHSGEQEKSVETQNKENPRVEQSTPARLIINGGMAASQGQGSDKKVTNNKEEESGAKPSTESAQANRDEDKKEPLKLPVNMIRHPSQPRRRNGNRSHEPTTRQTSFNRNGIVGQQSFPNIGNRVHLAGPNSFQSTSSGMMNWGAVGRKGLMEGVPGQTVTFNQKNIVRIAHNVNTVRADVQNGTHRSEPPHSVILPRHHLDSAPHRQPFAVDRVPPQLYKTQLPASGRTAPSQNSSQPSLPNNRNRIYLVGVRGHVLPTPRPIIEFSHSAQVPQRVPMDFAPSGQVYTTRSDVLNGRLQGKPSERAVTGSFEKKNIREIPVPVTRKNIPRPKLQPDSVLQNEEKPFQNSERVETLVSGSPEKAKTGELPVVVENDALVPEAAPGKEIIEFACPLLPLPPVLPPAEEATVDQIPKRVGTVTESPEKEKVRGQYVVEKDAPESGSFMEEWSGEQLEAHVQEFADKAKEAETLRRRTSSENELRKIDDSELKQSESRSERIETSNSENQKADEAGGEPFAEAAVPDLVLDKIPLPQQTTVVASTAAPTEAESVPKTHEAPVKEASSEPAKTPRPQPQSSSNHPGSLEKETSGEESEVRKEALVPAVLSNNPLPPLPTDLQASLPSVPAATAPVSSSCYPDQATATPQNDWSSQEFALPKTAEIPLPPSSPASTTPEESAVNTSPTLSQDNLHSGSTHVARPKIGANTTLLPTPPYPPLGFQALNEAALKNEEFAPKSPPNCAKEMEPNVREDPRREEAVQSINKVHTECSGPEETGNSSACPVVISNKSEHILEKQGRWDLPSSPAPPPSNAQSGEATQNTEEQCSSMQNGVASGANSQLSPHSTRCLSEPWKIAPEQEAMIPALVGTGVCSLPPTPIPSTPLAVEQRLSQTPPDFIPRAASTSSSSSQRPLPVLNTDCSFDINDIATPNPSPSADFPSSSSSSEPKVSKRAKDKLEKRFSDELEKASPQQLARFEDQLLGLATPSSTSAPRPSSTSKEKKKAPKAMPETSGRVLRSFKNQK